MNHPQHAPDPGFRYCPRCGGTLEQRSLKPGEPDRLCCTTCDFVFYLDPKLAAGAVVTIEQRLVLVRRGIEPAYGRWVFPGGYVDRGEHPEEAAVREAREEAGVEVLLHGLQGIYQYPRGNPVVIVVYHGEVTGGELRALDESLEARLFAAEELPWQELAFTTTRLAVADWARSRGVRPPPGLLPERSR
jgi:8-oxo-dGTP diphosphatase